MTLRIITWNVAGRKKTLAAQLGYLAEKQPQVVCLQEVTPGTVNDLCSGLVDAGLVHVEHTIVDEHPRRGPRRYGLLIAATTPLRRVAVEASWPERLLGVSASLAGTACTLFTTHIPPGSSNGWAKVDMLEAVAAMAKGTAGELIVCGDFNCPREERADGTVVTWAQGIRKDRSIYIKRGYERWDAAERGILQGLPARSTGLRLRCTVISISAKAGCAPLGVMTTCSPQTV